MEKQTAPLLSLFNTILCKKQETRATPSLGQQLLLFLVAIVKLQKPRVPDQEAVWMAESMVSLMLNQPAELDAKARF